MRHLTIVDRQGGRHRAAVPAVYLGELKDAAEVAAFTLAQALQAEGLTCDQCRELFPISAALIVSLVSQAIIRGHRGSLDDLSPLRSAA